MTTDTARHYAQKVRDTLKALHAAEDKAVDALTVQRDNAAYEAARREVHGLRATLALHAASLAETVLSEPASCPAKAAGHACELPAGHENVTLAFKACCASCGGDVRADHRCAGCGDTQGECVCSCV